MLKAAFRFVYLYFLAVYVKLFNFFEFLLLAFFYYPFYPLLKVEWSLFCAYFFRSPFKVAKEFALKRGEDPYEYGETSLISLGALLKKIRLSKDDIFYELGCGSGRSCFFVQAVFACQVIGVDWNPDFVSKAVQIQKKHHLNNLDFVQHDFCDLNFSQATCIYLYGSSFSESCIQSLAKKLAESVSKDCLILTVSYHLNDYCIEKCAFEILGEYSVRFVWGRASVFVQKKTESF